MKSIIRTRHLMTPKHLKKKIIKQIIKIEHEKLDTDEGESSKDEEESTKSTELSEENSTSDTPTEDAEESKPSETPQVPNILNKTTHDEDDLSHDISMTEFEPKENGE